MNQIDLGYIPITVQAGSTPKQSWRYWNSACRLAKRLYLMTGIVSRLEGEWK